MKSILLVLPLFLLVISCNDKGTLRKDGEKTYLADESKKSFPIFNATELIHDFGVINDSTKVNHDFTFTNTGESPLIISEVRTTCGCTVPEYPKDPVLPNESGTIKVVFNPAGKSGVNKKTITVLLNTEKGFEDLKITSEIK